jgi:anaerobic selenocysteine-containing dehydrogenase
MALGATGPGADQGGVRELREPGTTVGFADVFPSFPDRRARLHVPAGELPVPRYVASDDAAHPLTLLTPASARLVNSMFGEFNAPPAVVSMSPNDAAARGQVDGGRVHVFNERAALELPLRVDAAIRDGVCVIPKGLWRHDGSDGLTANALCPDHLSDLAGGACFNDARVEVRRGA